MFSLLGLALILGLAESLSAFFLGRVRFESGPVWLEELALTAVLGTAACGALVLGLGALLKAVGRLVGGKSPTGGWRAVFGRLGGLPTVALIWLVIRLEVSGGSWVFRVVLGVILGAVLVLFMVRGLAPGLARARAAWPLMVGPLAVFVSWWAMGNLARKRFESDETWTTLAYAIAPLAICGVAWALTRKRPAAVRGGVVLLALVLSAGMMFSSRPEVPEPPEGDNPNVIFIVVDTLRADRV
ncbi:MAG: hypothetical protein JRF63_11195, partial [Deltaproteobacteria bacterium]|nr:hypothetical protein [Deltaproteobacteria bacterium]